MGSFTIANVMPSNVSHARVGCRRDVAVLHVPRLERQPN